MKAYNLKYFPSYNRIFITEELLHHLYVYLLIDCLHRCRFLSGFFEDTVL